jgi:hypothetical protein
VIEATDTVEGDGSFLVEDKAGDVILSRGAFTEAPPFSWGTISVVIATVKVRGKVENQVSQSVRDEVKFSKKSKHIGSVHSKAMMCDKGVSFQEKQQHATARGDD